MTDPDLELRGVGGVVCSDFLTLLAFLPSVISSFFTQNKGATGSAVYRFELQVQSATVKKS